VFVDAHTVSNALRRHVRCGQCNESEEVPDNRFIVEGHMRSRIILAAVVVLAALSSGLSGKSRKESEYADQ
jgi:hypothetical protein